MITRLRLQNFKNFADAELKLGAFTVILGTNASGKSNIRDAFRFLHGIGRGYSLSEIIGGKFGDGGQKIWSQMRGAMNAVSRIQSNSQIVKISVDSNIFDSFFSYELTFGQHDCENNFSVGDEFFTRNGNTIFSLKESEDYDDYINLNSTPFANATDGKFVRWLEMMRFHEIDPNAAKLASPPGQKVLGDHGENLPTVLQAICTDPARKETLMEWVRALTPMDVVDFKFRTDLNGFVQLYLVESDGAEISAVSASDGTLRFLALLAALLGPNPAKLYFFEEIESGIHPARLHLLIDMLERQTAKSGIQVVTTTHSPELLSLLSDETLKSTSIVYRPPGRSDAIIKPVLEFPNIEKLRVSQGLGRLHAAGWFEDVLAATLNDEGDAA